MDSSKGRGAFAYLVSLRLFGSVPFLKKKAWSSHNDGQQLSNETILSVLFPSYLQVLLSFPFPLTHFGIMMRRIQVVSE